MPWQLYLEKEPWDPLIRRLDGLQGQSVCFGDIFTPIRNQTLDCTALSLITIYVAILAPSPDITLFIIFIVVFDLSSSFLLTVMADLVSLTTSPVHSDVFDWYHSSLCRSRGELLVCLNRDFWRWSTAFLFEKFMLRLYFFLSTINRKEQPSVIALLKKRTF